MANITFTVVKVGATFTLEKSIYQSIINNVEALGVSERINIAQGKGFIENPSLSESYNFGIGKPLDDNSTLADQLVVDLSRGVSEQSSLADALALQFALATRVDESIISESLALAAEKGVIADSSSLSDDYLFSVSKQLTEAPAISEGLRFDNAKARSDSYTVTDISVIGYGKSASDDSATSDVAVNLIGKEFGRTWAFYPEYPDYGYWTNIIEADITDSLALDVSRPLSDHEQTFDDWYKDFSKSLNDESTFADAMSWVFTCHCGDDYPVINEERLFALTKPLNHSHTNISEIVLRNTNKGLSESPALSETVVSVFAKALADTTHVYDDFDGVGGDDQTAVFGKGKTDSSGASDQFNRQVSYNRAYSDQTGTLEYIQRTLNKVLADTAYADSTEFELLRSVPQSDSFGSSDQHIIGVGKLFGDSGYSSDYEERSFGKAVADSHIVEDRYKLTSGKSLAESGVVTEDYIIQVGKNVDDGVTLPETLIADLSKILAENPSLADVYSPVFSKFLTDTSGTSDEAVQSFGKNPSDAPSVASDGELISQGYVNNNGYFSSDYVGQQRSFQ